MKTQKRFLKKFFSLIFTLTIVFSGVPFLNIAYGQAGQTTINNNVTGVSVGSTQVNPFTASQSTNPGAQTNNTSAPTTVNQRLVEQGILPGQQPKNTSGAAGAATEAVSCAAGGLLAQIITANVSSALGSLGGSVVSISVPTTPTHLTFKEVGTTIGGVAIVAPSWDSIAYCLGNGLITMIADATIEWIQTGFNEKPAFIDDPTKLFQDIADSEMQTFLGTLGGGFLCEPFESYISVGLLQNYDSVYEEYGRCTLDEVSDNIDSFLRGETFSYETWFAMTQNPANNPYGARLLAQQELQNRIQAGIGPVQLEADWGNGFLSFKNEDTGETLTPGQMVSMQIEKHTGLSADRLVLAEKFDQVLNALFSTLIETAFTEALDGLGGVSF